MQISFDPAPIGTVQPELPGQLLPEPEHKQLKTGFTLIGALQSGVAWFQWHSEHGAPVWAYPWPLRALLQTHKR